MITRLMLIILNDNDNNNYCNDDNINAINLK